MRGEGPTSTDTEETHQLNSWCWQASRTPCASHRCLVRQRTCFLPGSFDRAVRASLDLGMCDAQVCGGGHSEQPNEIVFCERCDVAVHQECYAVPSIPEGACARCGALSLNPGLCDPLHHDEALLLGLSRWLHRRPTQAICLRRRRVAVLAVQAVRGAAAGGWHGAGRDPQAALGGDRQQPHQVPEMLHSRQQT